MTDSETHDIVPDDVDADVLSERMHECTTEPKTRCPTCGYVVETRAGGLWSTVDGDERYYCKTCQAPRDGHDVVKAETRLEVVAE